MSMKKPQRKPEGEHSRRGKAEKEVIWGVGLEMS